MNISEYYRLGSRQPSLDFVDIKLNTDNLLFIDPRLIENADDDIAKQMQIRIEAFWGELIKRVKSKDVKKIYSLLSGLSEPNETRLGYAFSKPRGNSVAEKLKPKIVDAIRRNKAVRTGVLSHFADVELFIEDIGSDRISDITTKIIKEVLIEYTQQQSRLHKNILLKEVVQDDIFDYKELKWVKKKVKLPVYDNKPILFVPKNIVRLENVAGQNLACFYRFAIRNFIVHDKDMLVDISPSGKKGEILLRDVKAEYPISKESLTNWGIKYGKLLVDYKTDHLNGRLRPLMDSEIMEIVYDDGYSQAG
ncbi:hypothetical protein [Aquimarina aggregata]|uniref:hypothetical protein n=1 Tax=Aquimarina aggregata TaxID=1642818 RepID=UPI002490A4F1|nr:hypothetical protein [Aquimarina aggregata]